jgi:hypothetical protein
MRAIAHALVVAGVIVLVAVWLGSGVDQLPGPLRRLADRGIVAKLAVAAAFILVAMLAMIAIDVGTLADRR